MNAREIIANSFGLFQPRASLRLLGSAADELVDQLESAGFVIVPKDPTHEMESLASEALRYTVPAWSDIYRAMIAAASQDK